MMYVQETEEMVSYLGRSVPRRGFRAFIYAADGRQKIAESYDEFDLFTQSEQWFSSPQEAKSYKKSVKKKFVKDRLIEEDFLPNDAGE